MNIKKLQELNFIINQNISLNKTVKNEEVWINEYETFEQAYEAIAQYIKKYNEKRLHSSIGYMPPNEYEQQQLNMAKVL